MPARRRRARRHCFICPLVAAGGRAAAGLDDYQQQVWQATQWLVRRPLGLDDFVPALGTGAGTCALATAFGGVETIVSGVCWVAPSITRMEEIDVLGKPRVTDGKLGGVLAQTRAYAACADERLPIRLMDFQSPFTTVEQLLGSDAFFLMPYDEPARLHVLMDVVTDFCINFFTAQRAGRRAAVLPRQLALLLVSALRRHSDVRR